MDSQHTVISTYCTLGVTPLVQMDSQVLVGVHLGALFYQFGPSAVPHGKVKLCRKSQPFSDVLRCSDPPRTVEARPSGSCCTTSVPRLEQATCKAAHIEGRCSLHEMEIQ